MSHSQALWDSLPVISVGSDNAAVLQNAIVSKLRELQLSAPDIVAEFVTIMCANRKSKDEIEKEIAEIIGDEEIASLFTEWVFAFLKNLSNGIEEDDPGSDNEDDHEIMNEQIIEEPLIQPPTSNKRNRSLSEEDKEQYHDAMQEQTQPPKKKISKIVWDEPVSESSTVSSQHNDKITDRPSRLGPKTDTRGQGHHQQKQSSNGNMDWNGTQETNTAFTIKNRAMKEELAQKKDTRVRCTHWPACTRETCTFWHPKEICPELQTCAKGSTCLFIHPVTAAQHVVVSTQICRFGMSCTRPDCKFQHSTHASYPVYNPMMGVRPHAPQRMTLINTAPKCSFWPNCLNKHCPFLHPTTETETNGAAATTTTAVTTGTNSMLITIGAGASLAKILCKFDLYCTRPGCLYMHTPKTKKAERVFAVADQESEKVAVGSGEDQA